MYKTEPQTDVKITSQSDLKMTIKIEKEERKDPTSFLPEEPMSYEIKKKKKKKKKKQEDDPFKDIEEKALVTQIILMPDDNDEVKLDPEVNIKVENIEVELDFNDFTASSDMYLNGSQPDEITEPEVSIENQNHEAVILTFENVNKEVKQESVELPSISTGTHICKVCHLVFKNQKSLHMHQKRKHKVFRRSCKYICDHCGMSYDTKNSLDAHLKRKHGPDAVPEDNEDKTCDICALVFKGTARLRMHMQRKHGSFVEAFQHECDVCGLTYEKLRSLVVHKKRKHSVVKKPAVNQWLKCMFCPKMFTNRETYARHMQRKHKFNEDGVPVPNDDAYWETFKNEAGEIACKECPLVFSSVSYLKLHMRRKHNALKDDFRLKCKICNLSYNKRESLKRHIRRKHGDGTYCTVCNKEFGSRESYLNHSHTKVIRECSICGLIFASQAGLSKHLRKTHKVDGPKVVYCNICNEGFHDKRMLRPHVLKVHLNVSYTCRFCKKAFKSKESYRRHTLFKHPLSEPSSNDEIHTCEECSETFPNEFEFCKHINMAHPKVTTFDDELKIKKEEVEHTLPFQCTKCPENYATWDELRTHFEQNHYKVMETQCQLCGEILPENELQKHIKIAHTENEEVQCRFCDFKTNNRASMTQHTLRHKNATTLHCDYTGCRYKTYYEGAMFKHKRKHQDLGVKLQCCQCPFQTMNKYILRYHEEAHMTGKKRYKCNQCDYATILPANLVQHKYKHSTEKRFKCEVCPFATKYNTSLRFHVKKKHCDLPTIS